MDPPTTLSIHLEDGSMSVEIDVLKHYPSSVIMTWLQCHPSTTELDLKQFKKEEFQVVYSAMQGKASELYLDPDLAQKSSKLGLTLDPVYGYRCRLLEKQSKKLSNLEQMIRGEVSSIVVSYDDYDLMIKLLAGYPEIVPVQLLLSDCEENVIMGRVDLVSIYGLPIQVLGYHVSINYEIEIAKILVGLGLPVESQLNTMESSDECINSEKACEDHKFNPASFGVVVSDGIMLDLNYLRYQAAYRSYSNLQWIRQLPRWVDNLQTPNEADQAQLESFEHVPGCRGRHHKHNLANLFSSDLNQYHLEISKSLDVSQHGLVDQHSLLPYSRYHHLYPEKFQLIPLEVAKMLSEHEIEYLFVDDLMTTIGRQVSRKNVRMCIQSSAGGRCRFDEDMEFNMNVDATITKQYFGFVNIKAEKFL
ncbi:Hypothetical protein POVR1_LOCUS38 [uncultured virus]|nr:Hypothetical protein POVR1_LOCUS38 [uncultured virus]